MKFDLNNLQLFVRAAALGVIGRAGEELGYSATNASHRFQVLEKSIGVTLFSRTTRSISLTPDGEVFLEHAKGILQKIEDAHTAIADQKAAKGTLRITASASFARSRIIPFVPEFIAQNPELHIDLHLSDAIIDIVEQGYDVAFRIGELTSSSLLARKLSDSPRWLVASPDYIARMGKPNTIEELADHICLPLGRDRLWVFRSPDGQIHHQEIFGPVSVNLGDAVAYWVLTGVGIGMASLWHAGPELRSGRLVRILPELEIESEHKIWAVRPPITLMPYRVQIFLKFIEAKIAETYTERYSDLLEG